MSRTAAASRRSPSAWTWARAFRWQPPPWAAPTWRCAATASASDLMERMRAARTKPPGRASRDGIEAALAQYARARLLHVVRRMAEGRERHRHRVPPAGRARGDGDQLRRAGLQPVARVPAGGGAPAAVAVAARCGGWAGAWGSRQRLANVTLCRIQRRRGCVYVLHQPTRRLPMKHATFLLAMASRRRLRPRRRHPRQQPQRAARLGQRPAGHRAQRRSQAKDWNRAMTRAEHRRARGAAQRRRAQPAGLQLPQARHARPDQGLRALRHRAQAGPEAQGRARVHRRGLPDGQEARPRPRSTWPSWKRSAATRPARNTRTWRSRSPSTRRRTERAKRARAVKKPGLAGLFHRCGIAGCAAGGFSSM